MADFKLDPKRTALLIQDMQNDVIIEGGAFAESGSPQHAKEQNVVENAAKLADACRGKGVPVIHVHYIVEEGAPGLKLNAPLFQGLKEAGAMVRGSWGAAPADGLEPRQGDYVVEKMRMSAWEGTKLEQILLGLGVDTVIVTGAWTNMSIEHTARTGADKGYNMVVPEDCCSTMNADWHNASINYALQNVSTVTNSGDVDRGAGRVKTRAAVFYEAGRPFEVRELDLEEPRAGEVLVAHGRGRHLRHRSPLGQGRVDAADADGSRARGRRRSSRRWGRASRRCDVGDHVVLSWAPSCGECADCSRGRPARCLALNRAIAASTLPDGTTGLSLDGETVLSRNGDRRARRADRRVGARGAARGRRRAARAGGAARLRRADGCRRGAVRRAGRAGLVRARRRRGRRRAVRRPGRAHRRRGRDRLRRSRSRHGASRHRGSGRRASSTRRSSRS